MTAPVAPRRPHVHREHGVERPDDLQWLRDRDDEAVLAHLQAENAWTEAQTAHLDPARQHLFREILGRIQETDSSVPVDDGGWRYYTRTEAGRAYAIHCRRRPDGDEVILCDENALAAGHAYFQLGALVVDPGHRRMALATDTTGGEVYTVRLRDLDADAELPDVLDEVSGDVVWSADGETLLYTTLDDTLRPHQVWRHRVGAPRKDDVLVYEEHDPTFRVGLSGTRDHRWLVLSCQAAQTTEVHLIPADRPDDAPACFSPRHEGHEYDVEPYGGAFLVLTNDSDDADGVHDDRALTFALKRARLGEPRAAWETVLPCRAHVTLEGVDAFDSFYVVFEREDGLVHLRIRERSGADARVPMPEAAWAVGAGANPDPTSRRYRFTYTSLTTPASTMAWDLDAARLDRLKQAAVLGPFRREDYVTRRLTATSADGTTVPISLVHRRDLPAGPAPCLLQAYGAYGIPEDPTFSSARLSLLDRGVVVALAHVRGGGDLGRGWYEAGRLQHKHHTFEDAVAVAEALIAAGVTAPDRLALEGGSAGGLLVGATLNLAPDRFCAAVAQVPFVDVLTTMLDPTIPLTTNEYGEWGDPSERDAFDWIRSWSPYDNVDGLPYPDLLVTSGLNDPRVPFWEPTKWVARLRERAVGEPQILLKTWLGAGHAGSSGRYGWIEDLAFVWAWLLDRWHLADQAVGNPGEPLDPAAPAR
jgi:oligopeptidase B